MTESENPTETTSPDESGAAAQQSETDWKAEARKWEQRAKENTAKLKEIEPNVLTDEQKQQLSEYQNLVAASQSDMERLQAQLADAKTSTENWQTEAQRWRSSAVGSRIEALAATEFADPSDAISNLDASKYLDAGGTIDGDAIKADLAALLEAKPHYRKPSDAQSAAPRVPAPNRNQGSGVGGKAALDPRAEFAAILQNAQR